MYGFHIDARIAAYKLLPDFITVNKKVKAIHTVLEKAYMSLSVVYTKGWEETSSLSKQTQ